MDKLSIPASSEIAIKRLDEVFGARLRNKRIFDNLFPSFTRST
jgi:hypothetical protein